MYSSIPYYDATKTKELISFAALTQALRLAALELHTNKISCPDRQVLSIPGSESSFILSMPTTATDFCVQKLISVIPENPNNNLPTIQGTVTAIDSKTGTPIALFDGPTITTLRTAALSMLGIQVFSRVQPKRIVLMGSGTQVYGHVLAITELYPEAEIVIATRNKAKAEDFCKKHIDINPLLKACAINHLPRDFDVVITLTSATSPIYHHPAQANRLVIGVGAFRPEMAETCPNTIQNSYCVVDEEEGARYEAGDLIRSKKDWNEIHSLAYELVKGFDSAQPVFFKTVGCAAWDLAAVRCALAALNN